MVAHPTCNRVVTGSSPVVGSVVRGRLRVNTQLALNLRLTTPDFNNRMGGYPSGQRGLTVTKSSLPKEFNVDNKHNGNLAVASAIHHFVSEGYTVSIPLSDTAKYDWVVER